MMYNIDKRMICEILKIGNIYNSTKHIRSHGESAMTVKDALRKLEEWTEQHDNTPDAKREAKLYIKLTATSMSKNYFAFRDKYYKTAKGTVMDNCDRKIPYLDVELIKKMNSTYTGSQLVHNAPSLGHLTTHTNIKWPLTGPNSADSYQHLPRKKGSKNKQQIFWIQLVKVDLGQL